MALIDHVWFAALTRHLNDAGTDNSLNLTVNIAGTDVIDTHVGWHTRSGQGYFLINNDFTPFDSNGLTDSSVRIGIRGDDAWAPEHILIFGHSPRLFYPVAMETDIDTTLSADPGEGHLTMPLRLVATGDSTTVIRRLLLLVDTRSTNDDAGTDSPVQLQITAAGNNVFTQQLPGTAQDDLENWRANWYFLDGQAPFTRGDVIGNGGITLSILDTDAWQPSNFVLFGLDTPNGRPNKMVSLVAIIDWNLGWLSGDPAEGKQSVSLPISA